MTLTLREKIGSWLIGQTRSDALPSSGGSRSDAQSRLPGELTDATTGKVTPFTWVSDLVKNNIRDHYNAEHRDLVAELDPHAHLWVYGISLNVWDDWFDFVDTEGNIIDAMQGVQDEFMRLRLKEVLLRVTPEERKHGWGLIYKVYEGARNRRKEEADWMHFMGDKHAYTDTPVSNRQILSLQPLPTIDLEVTRCDDFNQPTIVQYTPSYIEEAAPVGGHKFSIPVHASRFWWLNPRPKDRSWQGHTALAPIWAVLVAMREHLDNMATYAGKFGAGLLLIRKKGATDDELADEMDSALQNVGKRRHLQLNINAYEDAEWKTPTLQETGMVSQIESLYGMLSAGTGLPKTRWYGAQAGNLEGSRTNLKLEWGVISAIQASYEPIIRAIVHDLFPGQYPEFEIKWRMEYQMDDTEQAELQNLRADAVQKLSTVASMEELREIAKLSGPTPTGPTMAQEQQDAVMKLATATKASATPNKPSPPYSSAEEPTRADAKRAIRYEVFPSFVAHWEARGYSRSDIIRATGIGRATFYKHIKETGHTELHL